MSMYKQLCLAVSMVADPRCKSPRKRLVKIRRMLEGERLDRLYLARICLDEVERDGVAGPTSAQLRKQKKRLARIEKLHGAKTYKPPVPQAEEGGADV